MALFKAFWGRKCRYPICWFAVGEASLIGPDLNHKYMEKVVVTSLHYTLAIKTIVGSNQTLGLTYYYIQGYHIFLK